MRHFTKAAAAVAVVAAGSASSALAVDVAEGQLRAVNGITNINVDGHGVTRTGTSICYSALDFSGFGFTGGGGSFIYADDILMNKPAGTRIDSLSFSVVNFNTTTTTSDVIVGLFNAGPDGLPDFSSAKAQIPVTGIQVQSYYGGSVDIDVKDLNIVKKDEVMWAALLYTNVVGGDIANMGQLIANPATKGFSEDFFFSGESGNLSFFNGDPYANFGWEFRSVPTPGAMAIFGLAGVAATRRRR